MLLRDNLLTLRNARFRNIQSRVEKMTRIDADEYSRKLAQIDSAIALQDLFNRYYTSLYVSIDLSSQSNQFGVFNKGWFYDQQPEFVLRREFASIGNKLASYAEDADFGVRVRKLWQWTDDQIRQAVLARQWGVSSGISDKAALEGKTLETLLSSHYGKLTGLSGVSRLMKMQFEQWRNRGEPSRGYAEGYGLRPEGSRTVHPKRCPHGEEKPQEQHSHPRAAGCDAAAPPRRPGYFQRRGD